MRGRNEIETPKQVRGDSEDKNKADTGGQTELVPVSEDKALYEAADSSLTYLIFSVRGKVFAIKTSLVKEIMHSAKIHPLPFVPDYIEGAVNCHGTPFTVVNPLKLSGEEESEVEGGTVLVFKRSDDNFAIHISNIEVFFEVEDEDIRADGIRYKANVIPFFDADFVEEKMRDDLREKEE